MKRLDFSQVHIEQVFFAICDSRSMAYEGLWVRFFQTDRRQTDRRQTDRRQTDRQQTARKTKPIA